MFMRIIAVVGFLLALWVMVATANQVQILKPANCKVMEQCLQQEGRNIQVMSGTMFQAGGRLVAVMTCKLPNGTITDITYDLGPADQQKGQAK